MINNLLFSVFFLAGMIGLIVSVIIVCKKENFNQNVFLSLCLFVLSSSCIYALFTNSGNLFYYPKTVLALKSSAFLVAPCAYLYCKKMIDPGLKFRWYHYLNFVPAAISLGYSFTNITKFIDSNFWVSNNLFFNTDFYTFNMTVNLIWLFYAYTQILMIFTNPSKIAFLSEEKIKWLKAFSFFSMLLFVSLFLQKITGFTFRINLNAVNSTIISFVLLSAGYIIFFKPAIFFEVNEPEKSQFIPVDEPAIEEEDSCCKIPAGYLTKEKIGEYSLCIELALADKPFLQKGFVIRDLSDLTKIPVHHLSHFINSQYNLHFQDFINKKRIEYLMQQMEDKEWKSLSLEGQAWAAGFKSRTTFFRAFTKLMGKSPSEYVNSMNKPGTKGYSATA
ncbi:helix-turn-helix domain-containing protein [Flavobacterium hauense]